MLQDRNIHRDAQALRKSIVVPLIVPSFGVDQDEPAWVTAPRYNWRLSDLYGSQQSIATADLIVKAQAVPPIAALGSPQLAQAAAVTFAIEEFWRRGAGTSSGAFINRPAIAAQAFTAPVKLPVAPWEAALGARVTVPLPSGNVDLKIPAGSNQGSRLRLKSKGIPAKQPGDFYVLLDVQLPPADSDEARALYTKMSEEMPFNPRATV